jgi:predicted RNase H-like HicB family nuclease
MQRRAASVAHSLHCESDMNATDIIEEIKRQAGDIRIEYDEDAPLLWSVWCVECEDIIGAGDTEEEALNDALDTIAGWLKDSR